MSVLGSHTLNFQAMADAHAHIPRPENQAKFKLRGSKKLLDDSVQDDEPFDEVQPRTTKQPKPAKIQFQPLSTPAAATASVAHSTTSALG